MLKRRTFLTGAAGLSLSGCVVLPQGQSIPTISMPQFLPPSWMAEDGKTHYQKRVAEISAEPPITGGVLLIGDSITEGWRNQDFPYDGPIANHGIGWDTSAGLLARKELAFREKPDVVFLMIGTNDLSYDRPVLEIAHDIERFLFAARQIWPDSKTFIQSVLPRDEKFEIDVEPLNAAIKRVLHVPIPTPIEPKHFGVEFIDLTEKFSPAPGVLNPALTYDGLHLNAEGYRVWAEVLKPYLPS